MNVKKPELVAPSGGWSALESAVRAGADAVYFGIRGINMRQGASNFDILEMSKVMDRLHAEGKKGYLALNVLIYNNELGKIEKILRTAKETGVDAVVLWDMAALSIARELGLKTHLSTQASVSNFEALKLYSALGVERIVLARECTLKDIKKITSRIAEEKINCKVEAFIHGALCVSVSGRCFLSQDTFSKSANRGECIQPCRREFVIKDVDGECEYILGRDHILSPKDLCTLNIIDKLITSGISAFKIEGRIRPPEYVSVVTSVYRAAIDAFFDENLDQKLKENLLGKLKKSFNRGFSEGFYEGRPYDLGGTVQKEYEKVYLGEVRKFYKKIGVAEIMVLNGSLKSGQKILITGRKTPAGFTEVSGMEIDHEVVEHVPKGNAVGVKVPFVVRPKDKVFLWKETE